MAKSSRKRAGDAATTAAGRSSTMPTDTVTSVTDEEIARRAYDLYLARDRQHGHDAEDWLRAERELRTRRRSSAT